MAQFAGFIHNVVHSSYFRWDYGHVNGKNVYMTCRTGNQSFKSPCAWCWRTFIYFFLFTVKWYDFVQHSAVMVFDRPDVLLVICNVKARVQYFVDMLWRVYIILTKGWERINILGMSCYPCEVIASCRKSHELCGLQISFVYVCTVILKSKPYCSSSCTRFTDGIVCI